MPWALERQPRTDRTRRLSERAGYPPIFLGAGSVTQTLVAIASREPATTAEVRQINPVINPTLHVTVARLVSQRLVRRFWRPGPGASSITELVLERDHPQFVEVRSLIKIIAASNEIPVPLRPRRLPDHQLVTEKRETLEWRLFRGQQEPWSSLFGSRKRTLTLLMLALAGDLDATTICRIVRSPSDKRRYAFLDPLEDDALIERRIVGDGLMWRYGLVEAYWTKAFRRLARAIANEDDGLQAMTAVASRLMTYGNSPIRKGFRRHIAIDDARHRRVGRAAPTTPANKRSTVQNKRRPNN